MKKVLNLLTLAILIMSLGSCKEDDHAIVLKTSITSIIQFSNAALPVENQEVNVTTNAESWEVESGADWCIVEQDRLNSRFTVSALPNITALKRNTTITVTVGGLKNSLKIDVEQAAGIPQDMFLSVDPTTPIEFTAQAETTENKMLAINTNAVAWDATSSAIWCVITKTDKGIVVSALPNTTTSDQTATITISATDIKEPILISVRQLGAVAKSDFYTFTLPDFSKSNVYLVKTGDKTVAQVCREYLYKKGIIDVQAAVVYLVDESGNADLTNGFIAKITQRGDMDPTASIGGTLSFEKIENSISGYIAGNKQEQNSVTINVKDKKISFESNPAAVELTNLQADVVKDVDDNTYPIVKIATQYWMGENLRTTKYNDGTQIIHASGVNSWVGSAKNYAGAFGYPSDDIANKKVYGCLYNAYALGYTNSFRDLANDRISPSGWRLPSGWKLKIGIPYVGVPRTKNSDMDQLLNYLQDGAISGAAPKMRKMGTWKAKVVNGVAQQEPYGTNISLFGATGTGFRSYDLWPDYNDGDYSYFNLVEAWWCSTIPLPAEEGLVHFEVEAPFVLGTSVDFEVNTWHKGNGLPVRCIRK